MVRDPKGRLGSGERDANELKEHPFFSDINFIRLQDGAIPPPWQPTVAGSLDTSQFDQEFTSMLPVVSPDVRDVYFGSLDQAFEGFSFVDDKKGTQLLTSNVMLAQKNSTTIFNAQKSLPKSNFKQGGNRFSK